MRASANAWFFLLCRPLSPPPLHWLCVFGWAVLTAITPARAAETIPPAPRDHFNDYAGAVSQSVARRLNERLAAFERENSSQVVVAVFPRMQSDAPVGAYTLRVAQAWGAGRKDRDNGVVLFAFMQERQLYLQVGTGLETKIPAPLAKRIIEHEIVPRFRAGDRDGGFTAGVEAILAAIRANAPPPEQTPVEAVRPPLPVPAASPAPQTEPAGSIVFSPGPHRDSGNGVFGIVGLLVVIIIISKLARLASGSGSDDYGPHGRRRSWPPLGGGWSGHSHRPGRSLFRSGGSSFGGRSSGSGSFSGGGGGFRGGGAGGSW